MSRYGYCHDEREHERRAESDARGHRPDRDYYDRYTDDPCKEAYTESYDREIRSQRRQAEERQELEALEQSAYQRRFELEAEEQYFMEEEPRQYQYIDEEPLWPIDEPATEKDGGTE